MAHRHSVASCATRECPVPLAARHAAREPPRRDLVARQPVQQHHGRAVVLAVDVAADLGADVLERAHVALHELHLRGRRQLGRLLARRLVGVVRAPLLQLHAALLRLPVRNVLLGLELRRQQPERLARLGVGLVHHLGELLGGEGLEDGVLEALDVRQQLLAREVLLAGLAEALEDREEPLPDARRGQRRRAAALRGDRGDLQVDALEADGARHVGRAARATSSASHQGVLPRNQAHRWRGEVIANPVPASSFGPLSAAHQLCSGWPLVMPCRESGVAVISMYARGGHRHASPSCRSAEPSVRALRSALARSSLMRP